MLPKGENGLVFPEKHVHVFLKARKRFFKNTAMLLKHAFRRPEREKRSSFFVWINIVSLALEH